MRAVRLFLALGLAGVAACEGSSAGDDTGDDIPPDVWESRLNERTLDYTAALRTAALRLTGDLPTLTEIKTVADAAGDAAAQKLAYESLVREYLEGPRFARQALAFWRDSMKVGGTATMDTAPAFAAQLTVENRGYTELLTAGTGTCPTFDAGAGTFAPADCTNGVTPAAGVLSNPAVLAQFQSNLAFRRVRWVQEMFACTAFPTELTGAVEGAPTFLSPWSMESIAGTANGGTIDFHDTSAVICANCHGTMNHMAPLFGSFDDAGVLQPTIQVRTPLPGTPLALRTDWLPGAEPTAWRFGKPAADLPALGASMAADPAIAECAVVRLWAWALGKGDPVDTITIIPPEVIATQVTAFTANGGKLKDAIFAVYTSDDFVRF